MRLRPVGGPPSLTSTVVLLLSYLISNIFIPVTSVIISSHQSGLRLKNYAPDLLITFLTTGDNPLSESDVYNFYTHGCWCAKLDFSIYKNFLGGFQTYDSLDQLCKSWINSRNCNDRLDRGICQGENLASKNYTLTIDTSDYSLNVCESEDPCALAVCEIDNFFLQRVRNYLQRNSYDHVLVDGENLCRRGSGSRGPKACLGSIPELVIDDAVACTCQNGTALVDSSCPESNSEGCSSCHQGYELENGVCNYPLCRCMKGVPTVGYCTTDEPVSCESCKKQFSFWVVNPIRQ